ncbi:MAG: hypothetical protein R3F43_22670 [bacterium]
MLHDDEFELDGKPVGTCSAAVPSEAMTWTSLPDGLHPVFQFSDARLPVALVSARRPTRPRCRIAAAGYGPAAVWQIADRIWRLDVASDRPRQVQQLLVGTERPRIEMGFRRMPVIQSQQPCRWPSPGSQDGDGVRGRGRGSGSAGGGSGVPGGGRGGPAPEAARGPRGSAGAARRGAAGAGDAQPAVAALEVAETLRAGGRPHREHLAGCPSCAEAASWKGSTGGGLLRRPRRLGETISQARGPGPDAAGAHPPLALGEVEASATASVRPCSGVGRGSAGLGSGAARAGLRVRRIGKLEAAFKLLNRQPRPSSRWGCPCTWSRWRRPGSSVATAAPRPSRGCAQ